MTGHADQGASRGATSPRQRTQRRLRARALALAAGSWLAMLATWALMVGTYTGQRMEQLALTGSTIGAHHVSAQARRLLSVVSMPAAVALVLIILAAGLWAGRRHPPTRWRSLWAAGTVVAINVSAQVVKHWLLDRPDYGMSWRYDGANTLPSGHTAMAASVAVAALLVAPAAWRGWVAWLGALLMAAMGYSTLVCQWHRPADVVAAVLLAGGWSALAITAGAWSRDGHPPAERARRARAWATLLTQLALACLTAAAVCEVMVWIGARDGSTTLGTSVHGLTWWLALLAYAAGSLATLAVAALMGGLIALVSAED